jgi:hypothetical protein
MYPPKISDEAVLAVIRELMGVGPMPSGAAVRVTLEQRYQSRGGVARIYRLLASEKARLGSTTLSPIGAALLDQENRNLRELLRQHRQREDAHQAHWNREVGQLQQRVRVLESLVRQAVAAGDVTETLRRAVEGAESRVGQIEVLLRAFGPAAGRSNTGR